MYEFTYCLPIGKRVEWTAETPNSLLRGIDNEEDRQAAQIFIERSRVGDFLPLKSGAIIFHCNPVKPEPTRPPSRPLIQVMEDAGLLDDEDRNELML